MCASFSDGQADVAPRRLLRLADLQQATTAPPLCDRPPEEEKGKAAGHPLAATRGASS